MDMGLKGLKALVTGSSRGLGYATARTLLAEGAQVVINSRSQAKLDEALRALEAEFPGQVAARAGDIADPAVPQALVEGAAGDLGGLDILVANAGGPPSGAFETFRDETWQQAIDLSFMSHVRLIRAALPHLRRSAHPSVLTVTSYSVKQPIPNLVLSNSIRAATIGLTKTLALELGKDGIRFNSILPAWTETERVYDLMSARASSSGSTVEAEIEKQSKDSPLGRMGRPEEFASAAAFLVSPVASYITGVMLTVDGGMYKGTL